jgi:hypothetical protein
MPPPNPELVVREATVYESRSEQDAQTLPVLNLLSAICKGLNGGRGGLIGFHPRVTAMVE